MYDELLPFSPKVKLPKIRLSCPDITRWKMAWRTVQAFKFRKGDGTRYRILISNAITSRCQDWPELDNLRSFSVGLGFSTASFIYGGLHALAWLAHFDSSTEQVLWRGSACLVMGGVPAWYIAGAIKDKIEEAAMSSLTVGITNGILLLSVHIALLANRSR